MYLLGDLVEPEGDSRRVLAIEQSYTLQKGVQTVTLTVPFSVATTGLARLDLSIVDASDPSVEYQRAARQITTDAPELMALRTQAATLRTDQAVTLQLDWYSPKEDTVDVTLELDGAPVTSATVTLTPGFTSTTLDLPSSLEAGATIARASATVDGLTTRASTALVVEFRSTVYLPLVLR